MEITRIIGIIIGTALILSFLLFAKIRLVIHLIGVYNKAIKYQPYDDKEYLKFLGKRHLAMGICNYLLDKNPFLDSDWIDRYRPDKNNAYWYEIPRDCQTVDEIRNTLALRRKRLIYILKRLTIFP